MAAWMGWLPGWNGCLDGMAVWMEWQVPSKAWIAPTGLARNGSKVDLGSPWPQIANRSLIGEIALATSP